METVESEIDAEYMEEVDEIQELVFEEVFPILFEIDERYEEHSGFFTAFISCMHILFDQGWTDLDLLREVKDHYEIHLKHSGEVPGPDDEIH